MLRKKIIFSGRVQGVGMRMFVLRSAQACDLSGFVKNERDYVLCNVQGSTERLEKFFSLMTNAPWPIKIKNIDITDIAEVKGEEQFIIK